MDAMSRVYGVVAILLIHFLSAGVCTLPEPPDYDSACYGNYENVLKPSCANVSDPGSSSVIAVSAVSAGVKPDSSNCPAENTAVTNTSATCCVEGTGDCNFDIAWTVYHEKCSGIETCTLSGAQRYPVTDGTCGMDSADKYAPHTHYLVMDYYCVEGSRITSMCIGGDLTSTGPALYLQSPAYPGAIGSGQTGCNCSVETSDCDVDINMFHIHRDFTSSNGTCQQSLNIQGGDVSRDITCGEYKEYDIGEEMLASTYLVITMDNAMTTDGGHFWLGFQGSSFSLNCPATTQQHCFKDCSMPDVMNGTVTGNVTAGSIIAVSCDPGFNINGIDTLTCKPDGTWDADIPTCDVVSCPTLDVPHLTVTGAMTYGSTVTVTCDTGYNINGVDSLMCQDDGLWNNATPSCDVIGLGDPCQTNDDCVAIGDAVCNVTCICGPGHTDNGIGACPIDDCGEIDVPHATVTGNTTYASSLNVVCDTGYQINSVANLICLPGGNWSNLVPSCDIINCEDVIVANATVTGATTYEETVTVTCNTGYMINGSADSLTCGADGNWSHVIPTCAIIDCQAVVVDNAVVTGNMTYGSVVHVTCNVGHNLNGVDNLTCETTGNWTTDRPTCPIVDCGRPVISHATVAGTTTYEATVTVTCDSDYEMDEDNKMTCLAKGDWDIVAPTCKKSNPDMNSDIIIIVICVAVAFVLISVIIQIVVYVVCCRNKPQNETKVTSKHLEESLEIVPSQPEHEVEHECSRAENIKLRPDLAGLHPGPAPIAPLTGHPMALGGNTILAQNDTNSVQNKQATVNHTGDAEHIPADGVSTSYPDLNHSFRNMANDTTPGGSPLPAIRPQANRLPPLVSRADGYVNKDHDGTETGDNTAPRPPSVVNVQQDNDRGRTDNDATPVDLTREDADKDVGPGIEAKIVSERQKLVQKDGTSVEPSITIIDEGRHTRKKKKKKHKKHHRSDIDVTADTGETDALHIDDITHSFHNAVMPIDEVADRSGEERHRRKKKRKHRTKDIEEPSVQLE